MHNTLGHIACISDKDFIIAVAGGSKREYYEKSISADIEGIMEGKKPVMANRSQNDRIYSIVSNGDDAGKYSSQVIVPIVSQGDPIGAIILLSKETGTEMGESEIKVAETAAGFLARQMEQ